MTHAFEVWERARRLSSTADMIFSSRTVLLLPTIRRGLASLADGKGTEAAVDLSFSTYDEHVADATTPPVVIAHGMLGSKANWHSMARTLNRLTRHKIHTVDLRGHGDSPWRQSIDYGLLSDDLVRLVERRLQVRKVALVGHSLGGATALHVALKRADLVDCVVCVDISLENDKLTTAGAFLDAMLLSTWPRDEPSLSVVRRRVDDQLVQAIPDADVRRWLLTNLVGSGGRVRWRLDLRGLRNNVDRIQRSIKAPGVFSGRCLFVCGGASDYVRPSQHDAIRAQFPLARFESITGAGHWVHAEKPREFAAIVADFLRHSEN